MKGMKVRASLSLPGLSINKVIRFLVVTDLLLLGGWGFINPILAIFVIDKVPNATIFSVGIAMGIYLITKAVVQLPVAILLDKRKGEKDEFYTLITSLILAGFVSMAYLSVESVSGLYFVSFLQGLAFSLYTPSWSGIFSRHLDTEHYSFDWSLDSATIGIASGLAAIFGGLVASMFGFNAIFITTALFSFASALNLFFFVPKLILPKALREEAPIKEQISSDMNRP